MFGGKKKQKNIFFKEARAFFSMSFRREEIYIDKHFILSKKKYWLQQRCNTGHLLVILPFTSV